MSDDPTASDPAGGGLPQPAVRRARNWTPSLIWLVPLVAALAGIVLVTRALLSSGPAITISFRTAEGLEAGKTDVRYKDVVIGKVRSIRLAADRQRVIVAVELSRDAAELAVDDTRFWVVRPRVDAGGVQAIGTLLSGAYIGVDVGVSEERRRDFEGLEQPPAVTNDSRGRRFRLRAEDLGSLDIGSPVYYRRIPVGRIVRYELDPGGRGVNLQVFVDEPYDRFVSRDARFWHASGVDIQLDAAGFKIDAQSLTSVLVGGVAFQSAPGAEDSPPAPAETAFTLFADRNGAMAPPDGEPMLISMRFEESLRGLTVGSTIDFKGVDLGRVENIHLDYHPDRHRFSGVVLARIYPERLGRAYESLKHTRERKAQTPAALFERLVAAGLRAQLRAGNLITGQLYIALEFMPKAKRASTPIRVDPFEIPTERASLAQLQSQIAEIVTKLNEVPFGDIGRNARDALASADRLLRELEGELAPEARHTLVEARRTLASANQLLATDGGAGFGQTLTEVERAARSLRGLADYLQRHPESLLRGRDETPEPRPPVLDLDTHLSTPPSTP